LGLPSDTPKPPLWPGLFSNKRHFPFTAHGFGGPGPAGQCNGIVRSGWLGLWWRYLLQSVWRHSQRMPIALATPFPRIHQVTLCCTASKIERRTLAEQFT
jgi:hypothetical protein